MARRSFVEDRWVAVLDAVESIAAIRRLVTPPGCHEVHTTTLRTQQQVVLQDRCVFVSIVYGNLVLNASWMGVARFVPNHPEFRLAESMH